MSEQRVKRGARAAIYVRVSHREQETLKDQERRCRAFADAKGWQVAEVFSDRGVSAWSGKDRPGWLQLEAAVERGDLDAVIVFQVSRAARNVARLYQFLELCRERRVVFASTSEGADTSTVLGKMMTSVVAALAEMESDIRSERTLLGLERVRAEGRWTGGRRPFGFRANNGHLVPDEAEAKLIREAAERFLAGTGLSTIARDWQERGIKTARGGKWSPTTLHDILADERHAGTTLLRSDWDRVTEKLEAQARAVRPRGDRYMLTGILRCGVCEKPMSGQPRKGVRRYICVGGPHNTVIRSEDVEELVKRRAAESTVEVEGVADPTTIAAPLLAELEGVEQRLRAWARDAAEAGLSPSEIRAGREPLVRERDRIQTEIEQTVTRETGWASYWEELQTATEPTPAEWRAYIEQVVDHVLIGPAKTANGTKAPSTEARARIVWRDGVKERRG